MLRLPYPAISHYIGIYCLPIFYNDDVLTLSAPAAGVDDDELLPGSPDLAGVVVDCCLSCSAAVRCFADCFFDRFGGLAPVPAAPPAGELLARRGPALRPGDACRLAGELVVPSRS